MLHCYISQLESDRKALQGSTEALEKQTSPHTEAELNLTSFPVGSQGKGELFVPEDDSSGHFNAPFREAGKCSSELFALEFLSACAFTLSNVHMKAHSKWCQKGKRIVTEEPEINTLGCVTQSHLPPPPPPLTFYRWWHRQLYPPPPKKTLSLRLPAVKESSQVSVLPVVAPAVYCGVCGKVLKMYSVRPIIARPSAKLNGTNQLLLYIVCVNARWEPSHASRRRKPQSPLYRSVPNVCTCVRVLYACI